MSPKAKVDVAASEAAAVAGHLRVAVTRLARHLRQQDKSGLTPSLTAALATISREGPLTLGELAGHEGVTPPTVTKLVAALEERGLVARTNDEADRRVSRVALTSAGDRELAESRSRRTAWLAGRLNDLPEGDVQRLAAAIDVLERITAAPERTARP